jgi:hypothetical protein
VNGRSLGQSRRHVARSAGARPERRALAFSSESLTARQRPSSFVGVVGGAVGAGRHSAARRSSRVHSFELERTQGEAVMIAELQVSRRPPRALRFCTPAFPVGSLAPDDQPVSK